VIGPEDVEQGLGHVVVCTVRRQCPDHLAEPMLGYEPSGQVVEPIVEVLMDEPAPPLHRRPGA
jgi:hypothetical protein